MFGALNRKMILSDRTSEVKRMNKISIIFITVLFICSCSEIRFGSTSSRIDHAKESSQRLLRVKPNDDTDKISDGSEGVPGYLTDPAALQFSRNGDQGTIIGAAGAVLPATVKLSDLVVELWAQPSDTAKPAQARKITTKRVADDGSFQMQFTLTSNDLGLFIAVEKSPGSSALRVSSAGSGHYQVAYRSSSESGEGFRGVDTSDEQINKDISDVDSKAVSHCYEVAKFKGYTIPERVIEHDESAAYNKFRSNQQKNPDQKPELYEVLGPNNTSNSFVLIRLYSENGPVDNIMFKFSDSSATYCLDAPGISLDSTIFFLGCKTQLLLGSKTSAETELSVRRECI